VLTGAGLRGSIAAAGGCDSPVETVSVWAEAGFAAGFLSGF
jgi:hypothetical protein